MTEDAINKCEAEYTELTADNELTTTPLADALDENADPPKRIVLPPAGKPRCFSFFARLILKKKPTNDN